jgi:hypothetical protein
MGKALNRFVYRFISGAWLESRQVTYLFSLPLLLYCLLNLIFDHLPAILSAFQAGIEYEHITDGYMGTGIEFRIFLVLFPAMCVLALWVLAVGVTFQIHRGSRKSAGRLIARLADARTYRSIAQSFLSILAWLFSLFGASPKASRAVYVYADIATCAARRDFLVSLRRGSITAG